MHLIVALSVPTVIVLVGILLNNSGLNRVETNMKADLKDTKGDLNRLETKLDSLVVDLKHFYQLYGELKGKVDALGEKH